MYQLHKGCIFKFGCTFLVVLVQIMCDRKFKFCKNQPIETEKDNDSVTKPPKNAAKPSKFCNEQHVNTNVICNQPHSCYPEPHSSCHNDRKSFLQTCNCDMSSVNNTVCFKNKTSTIDFPPSFNLKSDKKSTPKQLSQKLNQTCSNNIPSPILKSNQKRAQRDTKIEVEVHRENNSQTDATQVDLSQSELSFHSM